jgi:hypothetical protein
MIAAESFLTKGPSPWPLPIDQKKIEKHVTVEVMAVMTNGLRKCSGGTRRSGHEIRRKRRKHMKSAEVR